MESCPGNAAHQQAQRARVAWPLTIVSQTGFDLLECQDMAEAIDVVSAHPLATRCVLEIRPLSA